MSEGNFEQSLNFNPDEEFSDRDDILRRNAILRYVWSLSSEEASECITYFRRRCTVAELLPLINSDNSVTHTIQVPQYGESKGLPRVYEVVYQNCNLETITKTGLDGNIVLSFRAAKDPYFSICIIRKWNILHGVKSLELYERIPFLLRS